MKKPLKNYKQQGQLVSLSEKYHYDESEDKLHIQRVQDVQPILEDNRRLLNDNQGFKSEIFNKKASIPMVILEAWLKEKGITYQEFSVNDKILKRFLNDPDNAFCLCKKGKL